LGERIPLVATSLENDIGTVTLEHNPFGLNRS
jgi:hypothetical protein